MAALEFQAGARLPPTAGAGRALARHRRPRRYRWPQWPAWVAATLVGVLLSTVTGFLNPDWFGYQVIFEDQGGWLTDQGRDPLFIALNWLGAWLFTLDGYDEFRLAIAGYFVAFTWLLCHGRVLVRPEPTARPRWSAFVALLLVVALFAATRFAIQIREGLAMTCVLFGLRQCQLAPKRHWPALSWFAAALLTHAGTALLMLALMLAMAVASRTRRSRSDPVRFIARLTPVALLVGATAAVIVLTSAGTSSLVDTIYGDIESTSSGLWVKVIYWSAMAVALQVIARETALAHAAKDTPPVLRIFVALVTRWLLPALYALIVCQLIGQGPPTLVSASVRLLQMLLALMLLMAVFRGRVSWALLATTAVLAADQARIVVESLFTTYTLGG